MSEYRWTQIAENAAFAPRDGAGALVFQNEMWLLGGWNPGDAKFFPRVCNSAIWSTRDGEKWTLQNHADWEGRHTAGYAVHNDKMWIVGGDPIQGHYQNDVWCSDDGLTWKKISERAPWAPRVLHCTAAFDGKLWVMGGQTLPPFAPAPEAFHNDVWSSRDGLNWTRVLAKAPWSPRGMIGGSAVFKGEMWLLGGGTYDTPARPQRDFLNEVWSTRDGLNWQRHADAPWAPRQYHDVAVFDGKLWVLEGYCEESGNRSDVWFSSDGENWQEVPGTPWAPRHAASVFVFQDALWMVSGNNMTSDVWKLERSS